MLSHLNAIGGSILPFIFVLSIVIFFHEFGHFIVGRLCGVKVDAFSLGFGPELFAFTDRSGTRWRLGLLPLGGYVKFHGDANGASMSDEESIAAMPASERAVTFFTQKVWKRALIVAAGPVANFILAIIIFTGIYLVQGRGMLVPQIDKVAVGSAASAAGFVPGDVIISIDGSKIDSFEDMQRIVQVSSNRALTFVVDRKGQELTLVATPQRRELKTPFGPTWTGVLGVEANPSQANWHIQHYGLIDFDATCRRRDLVRHRADRLLCRWPLHRARIRPISCQDRFHIAQVSGQMAKLGFRGVAEPCRGFVNFYWNFKPCSDPAARWRASFLLRDRGSARPRIERQNSAGRIPHRADPCGGPDDFCHLQ